MTNIIFLEETTVESFVIYNNTISDSSWMVFKEWETLSGRFANDNEDCRIFVVNDYFIIITKDILYQEV
jgi:hypothetical protein